MTDDELKRLLDANTERLEKAFEKRFDAIDQRFDAVDQRFNAVDQRFDAVDKRIDALDKKFDEKTNELRYYFEVTAEDFRDKFNLLAEGIANAEEKAERRSEELQRAIEDGQATTTLLYTDLDRRVRVLETDSEHS